MKELTDQEIVRREKMKEFEETLEYLSLPFYKRLFGRKK